MAQRGALKVVIVGSGGVAFHLAQAIFRSKHKLIQILSRDIDKANQIANPLEAVGIDSIGSIDKKANIIILAIKDGALEPEYLRQFPENAILCHTSGSVPMSIFGQRALHGIFYPLQTFSTQKEVDVSKAPICVESNTPEGYKTLEKLAKGISDIVYSIDSNQRKALHLAAVFACNFTNLMYDISESLCRESDVSFDLLRPLIMETAGKVQEHFPNEVQTGPAKRKDYAVINSHLDILGRHPEYQAIYRILSNEIKRKNEEL